MERHRSGNWRLALGNQALLFGVSPAVRFGEQSEATMRKTSHRLIGLAAVLLVACPLLVPSSSASPPIQPQPLRWVDMASTPNGDGYWTVLETGEVKPFGQAQHRGDAAPVQLVQPVVSMAAHPSGQGYWLAAADGGVFAFGAAQFHGSAADLPLAAPIVAMAATPTGNGYWLLGADGGVFTFGDAPFLGRPPTAEAPAAGMGATPSGRGYFIVHGNGGPVGFGDARVSQAVFVSHGAPFVDVASSQTGDGSWIAEVGGHVSAQGDARYFGGAEGLSLQAPIAVIVSTPSGNGYWLLGEDGGVFAFGDARFYGRP